MGYQRRRCAYTGELFTPRTPAPPPRRVDDVAETIGRAHSSTLADRARQRRFARDIRKHPDSFIARLIGPLVSERYRIERAEVVAKPGKRPYARFTVGDRTGRVALFHWCPDGRAQAADLVRRFPLGTVVIVLGTMQDDPRWGKRIIVQPRIGEGLVACSRGDYDPADYERDKHPLNPDDPPR